MSTPLRFDARPPAAVTLPDGRRLPYVDPYPQGAERELCVWCGGDAVKGSCCPQAIPCEACGAAEGQRCHRPSGHVCAWHMPRVYQAEARDALAAATAAHAAEAAAQLTIG